MVTPPYQNSTGICLLQGLACPCCGRAYRHSAQRDMMQCTLCRKHVHTTCDPEACEEKVQGTFIVLSYLSAVPTVLEYALLMLKPVLWIRIRIQDPYSGAFYNDF